MEKVSYSKIAPATTVFSHLSSPDQNMNVEEKEDTTADHEQNVVEEQEQVTAISEEKGENEETVKSLGMFPTTDLAQYMPRNIPRENVFPHQDVSQGERSCLTRKSDYIERKTKNLHPSDYPNENESYWHRQDMQRASHISEHERRRVPNTVRSNKAQSAKNKKKAGNRVKERNYLNTQTEEKRRKLINRSTLTDHAGREDTKLMPEQMLSMLSDDWRNILPEEVRNKFINRSKSIHPEDSSVHFKLLVDITTTSEKTGEKPTECRRGNDYVHSRQERNGADVFFNELFPGHQMFSMKKHSILVENHFKLLYEIATLPEKTGEEQKEIEKVRSEGKADTKTAGQIADTNCASQIRELMLHKEEHQAERQKVQIEVDMQLEILKDSENEKNEKKDDIKELQEKMKQSKKFVVCAVLIKECIKQLKNMGIEEEEDTPGDKEEIVVKEEEVKNEAVSKRYKHESTFIKLYRNIIRNEICRMMTSIDMVVSEAKHLLGIEKTRIFFDLLVDGLFHFESAGAISTFVPNMAESAVRLDVTSFFEHSSDVVNRIMALLLGCPDSKRLQQMPEQLFITLLQSVIVSFLSNNKTKRGKSLSHKGTKRIRLIMVAPRLFVIAVGEEIPEDVLVGLRHGDELIMNRFVDARLERMQALEIQDKRPIHIPYMPPHDIHTPYFPRGCRLFIYIPTENGSYWHKMDMMRDNRIRRHGK